MKNKDNFLELVENRNLPFSQLVKMTNVNRDPSRNPIFNILVAKEENFEVYSEKLDVKFESLLVDYDKAKFDLTVFINENERKICFQYNTDLYSDKMIDLIIKNFEDLLVQFSQNSNLQISDVCFSNLLGTQGEKIDYDLKKTLKDYLEQQVKKTPSKIAVDSPHENVKLTYKQLHEKSNQLARYISRQGIQKGQFVGVFMNRSIDMIVSILGIIKMGGVYVPIDPEYPQERIDFIRKDAQINLIISDIKSIEDKLCNYSKEYLKTNTDENDAIYMIYTSGSTGEPKGVLNINKALCNRILWMKDELNFTCKNKVLQKTPFSFDVSVWEIFLPLITGATLVIAKPEGHKDPEYLRDIIIEEHITIVHFVPSMLKLFLSEKDVQVCNKFLMYVICSGEELPYDLMIEFLNKFRKVTLYNLYGPTEAAIDVTYWKCNSYYDYKIIPIGKPIYNTEVYILDNCRKIVPTGAVGELFLGGVGLSKGYWNRLELTKSKFIKSNFPDNKTLYATGDLCKFLPDGNLVYCGRSDFQVKVHGLRIEIGEIESALKTFSDIIDAVVVFKDVLVAYLVTKSGDPINQEEIRKHLKNKIPIYMIPSLYFCIEKIPLTSNGKIDRNNLRNFKVEFTNYHNKTATPKDAIELLLINIWSRVLNVTDIGVDDNFFNLGGDSIKSIQIVSLAKDHNLICSPQDIFQYPTIHELASKLKIKKYIVENNDIDLIPPFSLVSSSDLNKVPKNVENAYPLSLLQQGLVYHSKVNKDYCTYITSYRLRSRFDYALLKASINYAAKFHEILRTSFDFANFSIPMQLVHKNFNAEIFVVDLKKYSNSKQLEIIKLWIDENKKVKFNWGRAPFFQFTVHLLNEQEFQFSIVEPILDGWSVSVLASTIFWNYKNLMAGNYEITYPVVPSYDQYLKLELGSINSKECREYWMEKVKTLPCTLLPRWNLKRETPPVIIRRQENISNRISQRLRKIAKELSLPLKNVLLAAHVKVMQIITGYEKLTIGLLTNGRPEIPNSEKMVGLFLNSLPYEIDFSGSSWDELIRYTLKIEIEGMPYRRYPLSQLNSKEVFF